MTAMRDAAQRKSPKGADRPRLAPPVPVRSGVKEFAAESAEMGLPLFPWQETLARYTTALGPGDVFLYREVAEIVARQNGKTTFLVPHIVTRLRAGRRIMHTAQNRELPREAFGQVADIMTGQFWGELKGKPRFANGQEEIRTRNGGVYRIVAPTRGGARGPSNDDVIIDELREMNDHDFIAAAKPTLAASRNPQMLYLSNAGTDDSEVLNALRTRAGEDPALAYLEWSASPERKADDLAGWLEANPSIGHLPGLLDSLTAEYRAHRLGGTLAVFETEHLCRWVSNLAAPLVDGSAWASLETDELGTPRMAYAGIALDPQMTRASVALAWRLPDERVALRMLLEATGSPINVDDLGKDVRDAISSARAFGVGYDPLTDAQLVRYLGKKTEPISGQKWANASARFAGAVGSATLAWNNADAVTDDLTWTTRKPHDESGSFQAVRADDDRPITAALAAIRAVWLASGAPRGQARIR